MDLQFWAVWEVRAVRKTFLNHLTPFDLRLSEGEHSEEFERESLPLLMLLGRVV